MPSDPPQVPRAGCFVFHSSGLCCDHCSKWSVSGHFKHGALQESVLIQETMAQNPSHSALRIEPDQSMMFKVDCDSINLELKHFIPSVVSLGLFKRDSRNSGNSTTNFHKEHLKKLFLLDIQKQEVDFFKTIIPDDDTRNHTDPVKSTCPTLTVLEKCYGFQSSDGKDDQTNRALLGLDAVFVTSRLWHGFGHDLRRHVSKDDILPGTSKFLSAEKHLLSGKILFDILKLENQIPLSLIRKTFEIILFEGAHIPMSLDSNAERQRAERDAEMILETTCCSLVSYLTERDLPRFRITVSSTNEPIPFSLITCDHLLHCAVNALWEGANHDFATRQEQIGAPRKKHIQDHHIVFLANRLVKNFKKAVNHTWNLTASTSFEKNTAEEQVNFSLDKIKHRSSWSQYVKNLVKDQANMVTAKELNKSGITFRTQQDFFPNLVPNRFIWWRATLFLPQIPIIDGHTESNWSNILAFEEGYRSQNQAFAEYLVFMNNLIKTEEDVGLLCAGNDPIMSTVRLKDYQEVANLFNHVGVVSISLSKFSQVWEAIREQIMTYHNWPARRRIVYFMDTYMNVRVFVSVIGGIIIMILTVLQTYYAMRTFLESTPVGAPVGAPVSTLT